MESQAGAPFVMETLQLSVEDADLPAALYRPATGSPRGSVVLAPGGLARGDLDEYRWAGERLADHGFMVLITTYRAPAPHEDGADVGAALSYLEGVAGFDSERVVAFGHSRGGLAVLCAAAVDPRIKAVVSIAAPTDLAEYVRGAGEFAPAARDGIVSFMGGAPGQIPEKYRALDVIGLAPRIRQPVLLIHGSADMRTPIEHSLRLEAALRATGNERVRLEIMRGVGHFLELRTLGYQFDAVISLVTSWLDDTFNG